MHLPTSKTSGTTTQCLYKSKTSPQTALLVRFDTDATEASFTKDRGILEKDGQKLGAITGLGDEAYYFSSQIGSSPANVVVNTVVVRQSFVQILVTGTATLQQTGSIAHYALSQFETLDPSVTTSTG